LALLQNYEFSIKIFPLKIVYGTKKIFSANHKKNFPTYFSREVFAITVF